MPTPVADENIRTFDLLAVCDHCECEYETLYSEDRNGEAPWICAGCYTNYHGSLYVRLDNLSVEETYGFDKDYESPKVSPLVLPEMRDRLPRLCSFEQELGAGGQSVATRLHQAGFASDGEVHGYATGTVNGFCHVEHDSSTESEIVYSRLALSKPPVANRFQAALDVVRSAISAGEARLTLRCGGHVHVDLGSRELLPEQRYGMRDVESLYHVWNHLEDVIYRLGSANWRTHRSLAGNDYAPDVRKGLDGHGSLGRYFEDSRGALNFANFLAARSYCRCGAFTFEDWTACTCDLPKATVEFRVFNGTANLRKIHAYTALSLALVEWAKRNPLKTGELPVYGWTASEDVRSTAQAVEALRFLFKELPLTFEEKKDLLYCAENSSLREIVSEVPPIRRNRRREEAQTEVAA